MVIALKDDWIWDSWYYRDGDLWHGYFLKAPKSIEDPDLRHWNVTQGHATSTDLVNWTHHGTCFAPADSPAWDDYTTWTGSVLRDHDGGWHLFYTGSSKAEDGLYQRIGHAVSDNGHDWQRVADGCCLDLTGEHAHLYEASMDESVWHDRAMRDPWVMKDPHGDGWLMFFTARINDEPEPNAGGCIGFATSDDLTTWTLQPPVFVGGFGQIEVPQVFEKNGRWYLMFCACAEHFSAAQAKQIPTGPVTGSHYLMGDSPRGPWRIADGPFLDGALPGKRYCARVCDTDAGLLLLGFVDRPDGDFVGQIADPAPVDIGPDGRLRVRADQRMDD
ncbi:family 43 glycosylhydrolase [Loktanella sp. SALINAS62]|uniref:family 43 glycosylhydrolase n=1 Tax=Loktanella sp. SALINAS62 TaxID=2706124 RepID=UPI001B8D001C|nr:family 43 glycosylhydrolase [Loktanella sp. SALINAS62]MBS1300965.1 family 43 glycosylhydrolase [Loktanella sp. SALINAS62]